MATIILGTILIFLAFVIGFASGWQWKKIQTEDEKMKKRDEDRDRK